MIVIITIVGVIVGLIVLWLLIALFMKKEYAVEREIIINRSSQEVFDYIKHIKNQDNYSKWNMTDPNMKKEYKGTDGTVGFVYAWDSENKNAGKGEQEIKNVTNNRFDSEVRFIRPFPGVIQGYMSADPIPEKQAKVKWGINGTMKYPMNVMLLFMNMDKMLGTDMATSLGNLKAILEK